MESDWDKPMESDWEEEFEAEEWVPGGSPVEGESPIAFACFCVYRDMGPNRSLRLAGEQKVNGKKEALHSGASGQVGLDGRSELRLGMSILHRRQPRH